MSLLLALPGWDDVKDFVFHHLDAEERREAVFVCKEFYKTICHLERRNRLLVDDLLIDSMKYKNIRKSIMSSNWRFGEVKVSSNYAGDASAAERTLAVVKKFRKHIKKFTLTDFPRPKNKPTAMVALLNEAADVVELSIMPDLQLLKLELNPDKEFSRLKHLSVRGNHGMLGMLDKIPDHTLQTLVVHRDDLGEEPFQTFVNRQNKLKKICIPVRRSLNVDHLALEELQLYDDRDDGELAALLKRQHALRYLRCITVGKATFNELLKMQNLEVLRANLSEECAGILENLKELLLRGGNLPNGVFRQVLLPKLEKFVRISIYNSMMTFEDVVALSRSAHNLQHIEIQYLEIEYVPAIIELFPKLKTLFVMSHASDQEPNDNPALSRQNLSLEEIVIHRHGLVPIGSLYDAINDCPNLRRISLSRLFCSEVQILGLIRSHPQLTHFAFNDPSQELFKTQVGDSLHPVLRELIYVFRASAGFKLLYFEGIAALDVQQVDYLLTDDDNRVIAKRYENADGLEKCDLKLLKRLNARDPFGNFNRNKLLSYD